jgi:hypothetical protein
MGVYATNGKNGDVEGAIDRPDDGGSDVGDPVETLA